MNVFIGIVALITSTYLGVNFSKKYTERKKFYFTFCEFNKTLRNEISFSQKSILEILQNCKDESNYFYKSINDYFICKKTLGLECKYINKDENAFFISYIKTIGSSDKSAQIKYLDSINEYLNEKLNVATLEEHKYKKTYLKLGFLVGLIILIILM